MRILHSALLKTLDKDSSNVNIFYTQKYAEEKARQDDVITLKHVINNENKSTLTLSCKAMVLKNVVAALPPTLLCDASGKRVDALTS